MRKTNWKKIGIIAGIVMFVLMFYYSTWNFVKDDILGYLQPTTQTEEEAD